MKLISWVLINTKSDFKFIKERIDIIMIASMLKIKHVIIIVIIIAVLGITIIFTLNKEKPKEIIVRLLGIDFPSDSAIEEFTYYKNSDEFQTKISMQSSNFENIRLHIINKLNVHRVEPIDLPNFVDDSLWWDLEINDIDEYYYGIQPDGITKTRFLYIFITKEISGIRYIYISY